MSKTHTILGIAGVAVLGGFVLIGPIKPVSENAEPIEIQGESLSEYNGVVLEATDALFGATDAEIKQNIKDALIAGKLPTWNGAEVPIEVWSKLYDEATVEVGIPDILNKMLRGENMAKEMRLKMRESGVEVKKLKKK